MTQRCPAVFLWLCGIFVLSLSSATDLRGEQPTRALAFVDFALSASPGDCLAAEYYFEQEGKDRLIVRFYRPKEGVEHPAADLADFHFFQAEYFVGDWFVIVDESDEFEPGHAFNRSELKRDYLTRYRPIFLSQEEGKDIDGRPNSRRFIKNLGTVPMPDFPAEVQARFRRVIDN